MSDTNVAETKKPSVEHLHGLLKIVNRINNGRLVHARDNIRQALYLYIVLIEKGSPLSEECMAELPKVIKRAHDLMNKAWYR